MIFVNLTPHEINLDIDGAKFGISPTQPSARVSQTNISAYPVWEDTFGFSVPVSHPVYGEIENLPEPVKNKIYIVSAMVAQLVPHRPDVFSPDSGPTAIRNDKGQIQGIRGLVSYYDPTAKA